MKKYSYKSILANMFLTLFLIGVLREVYLGNNSVITLVFVSIVPYIFKRNSK